MRVALTLFAAAAWLGSASAQGLTDSKISNSDYAFVTEMLRLNQTHVQLGKAAHERGSADAVRDFANHMTSVHERHGKELLALLTEQGIGAPPDQKAAVQALIDKNYAERKESAFDRQYVRQAINDLRQMQTLLTGEAKAGEAAYLRSYAAKVLPDYQKSLRTAEELAEKLAQQ